MVAPIPDDTRREVIRLRVEERLGIDEIVKRTGVSNGTVSTLLRKYPLTDEETRERKAASAIRNNQARKYQPSFSKFFGWVQGKKLATDRKGRIAENAVRLRLELLEYDVYLTPENSRTDFVVGRPSSSSYIRLQVKWARRLDEGRPFVNLLNGEGKKQRRVSRDTCDFVIGYDHETDTAYVFPIDVCATMSTKSCDEQYAEAWHLLGI